MAGSAQPRPRPRIGTLVGAGAVVSFGWYAAVKGAYLSTTFSSLIVERNLVYLAPLSEFLHFVMFPISDCCKIGS